MRLRVERVTANDWATFKQLRLEALQESPGAFGSTYADMRLLPFTRISRPVFPLDRDLDEPEIAVATSTRKGAA